MSFRAIIIATLALTLAPLATAQIRRDGKGVAPPPVISQTIAVRRGEKIEVPLGIYGTRGELLEFLIRTPPAHGKLSAIKSMTMNTATVTYTPSLRATAAEDRFAYAVRGSEGVSAPGVITLRFVEPVVAAPRLRAPNEIDFPPVFPGQRSTAEMELANEGGGMIEGEIAAPDPWSIEGLKFFRLGAGQRTTIKLVFTPTQPGVRTGEAVLTGTERKIIPLRASAEERLAATPPLLKLTAHTGSQTRTGVVNIANQSDEDASVAVEAGARLLTDRSVKVPAHGKAALPVFADAAEVAAFDDIVKLSSREWQATVRVHAVAVGGILKFSAKEVAIAGSAADADASSVAILENSGGEALTVRLDVVRPFEVENRVVTVPARGRVEIPVLVRDAAPGTFRSTLKAAGEGGSAFVPVMAEISEAPARRPFAASLKVPEENSSRAEPAESAPQENDAPLIPQNARETPNALGRFARATSTNSATLGWPASLGPLENARVEERVLSLSANDELQIAWSPIAAVSITPGAERVTAELRGLKPGTFYTVRVVTGKDADASALFTTDFWTAPKKPLYTGSLSTPLLVFALSVLLFAIWRSRHAPQDRKK